MKEKALLWLAASTAIAGLLVLLFTTATTSNGFRLHGTVIEDHGTQSTVLAKVTLVARDVRRGDTIDLPVFWGGESFVAIPQQTPPLQE